MPLSNDGDAVGFPRAIGFSHIKSVYTEEYIPQTLVFSNIKHNPHPREKNHESGAAITYKW